MQLLVRPFLTRNFLQELFGLEGSNKNVEKNRQVHNLKISDRLLRSKSFFQNHIDTKSTRDHSSLLVKST